MSLGQQIKKLREERGLTQEELGKVLNVSKPSISRYEANANEPNTETLKQLAQYFNVSVDYLLGNSNIRNPYSETENTPKQPIETPEERKARIKTLREELIELMIKRGLIKSKADIDDRMLEIILSSIETYAKITNNERKDQDD